MNKHAHAKQSNEGIAPRLLYYYLFDTFGKYSPGSELCQLHVETKLCVSMRLYYAVLCYTIPGLTLKSLRLLLKLNRLIPETSTGLKPWHGTSAWLSSSNAPGRSIEAPKISFEMPPI